MALTQISTAGVKDDIVTAAKIADDAVTEALISDDSVDEARLKISNAGSNGQFLSKQSGNTGGLTWAAATNTAINNNADNRVITGSGTANTLEGEANLTYDGNNLQQSIDSPGEGIRIKATGDHWTGFYGNSNRSSADTWLVNLTGQWNDTSVGQIAILSGADTTNKDDGRIAFYTSASDGNDPVERMRIDEGGDVKINDGNLIIGTSGHGIDFAATSDGTGGSSISEVLDDYEEGTWIPQLDDLNNSPTWHNRTASYTKIGDTVRLHIFMQGNSSTAPTWNGGNTGLSKIIGVPFPANGPGYRSAIGTVWSQVFHWAGSNNNYNVSQADAGSLIIAFTGTDKLEFHVVTDGYPGIVENGAWADGDALVEADIVYRTAS